MKRGGEMEVEICEKCGLLKRPMHCDICKKPWPESDDPLVDKGWTEIRMVDDPEPDFISLCMCPECFQNIYGKAIAEKIKSTVSEKGETLVVWGGV